MRRTSIALLFGVLACARTGLMDFGRGDSGNEAGAGGSGGSASGSGGTGGTDECLSSSDCPVDDPCAPPVCRPVGEGSNARMRCIATPLECDDRNPCTSDSCDAATGACVHEAPVDQDGDGFLAEPPADAPAMCGGPDCDDEDASVNPLGVELCDGVDNDCDRAIDEGFDYSAVVVQPLPFSPAERGRATRGGLVHDGMNYAVSYNTTSGHKQSFFKLLTDAGQDASQEVEVSQINADAYAGPIEWSGSSFLTAFSDARQGGNYEVYGARFRDDGVKVQGDVRLTEARDFSLNPAVVWTGEEYVVAWDDRRGRSDGGAPQVYARRISEFGEPIGDEVLLSSGGEWGEYPALAVGDSQLGLAYVSVGSDGIARGRFRTLDFSLEAPGQEYELPSSTYINYPVVAFAGEQFLVAWALTLAGSVPGPDVRMASVRETIGVPTGGEPVTFGFAFARGPTLVSLGDRAALVYSAAGADGAYELWQTTVDAALEAPSPAVRLTFTEPLSLFPYAARGPRGTIGIVFDEDDETPPTTRRPHFMAIGCGGSLASSSGPDG